MGGEGIGLRLGVDTGGTFTDLVVHGLPGGVQVYKRPTTPDDPVRGLLDVIGAAAEDLQTPVDELLGRAELLVFGTTRATNAIIERATAHTALLVTKGHPDVLVLREGGDRPGSLYDWSHEYYLPHVPRAMTFEVTERMGSQGEVSPRSMKMRPARYWLRSAAATPRQLPSACFGPSRIPTTRWPLRS